MSVQQRRSGRKWCQIMLRSSFPRRVSIFCSASVRSGMWRECYFNKNNRRWCLGQFMGRCHVGMHDDRVQALNSSRVYKDVSCDTQIEACSMSHTRHV
uniref:Uncharacterized protein n=1 Tax=Hyaloperonospora arabidopsidis (strain Emoy2) TaxID=559515 RepID=M4B2D0_HYAAE